MLIAGVVLLVVAVIAVFVARSERGKARKATATETLSCGDVATLSSGVAAEVGAGSFSQRCEAVGTAAPGPDGLVDAPESQVDAVWVRTKVIHKYWVMEETRQDGKTTRTRREREETVSENESTTAFQLTDATGSVVIRPDGADVDRPEKVVDRFEARSAMNQAGEGFLSSLLRVGNDTGTLGFQHQEWVIRPGEELYVQGEVSDRTGPLVFAKPEDKGDYLISTRSEDEIVAGAERNGKIAVAVAGVAGVVGIVLLIAGAVTA
ncbi:GIDE domain-containing protein [Patulibacter sp. NPDC049589]|uniref:GIDE domain-containing protein n=1 Tax=Patulibacter sp. NPDC049589 TaxID=3154731 RepID=UPI00341F57F3